MNKTTKELIDRVTVTAAQAAAAYVGITAISEEALTWDPVKLVSYALAGAFGGLVSHVVRNRGVFGTYEEE